MKKGDRRNRNRCEFTSDILFSLSIKCLPGGQRGRASPSHSEAVPINQAELKDYIRDKSRQQIQRAPPPRTTASTSSNPNHYHERTNAEQKTKSAPRPQTQAQFHKTQESKRCRNSIKQQPTSTGIKKSNNGTHRKKKKK